MRAISSVLLVSVITSGGCLTTSNQAPSQVRVYRSLNYPFQQRLLLGASVENRPIECIVLGRGEVEVLMLATIHGNESAGTPLLRMLGGYLLKNPHLLQARRVVLVPVANPDGMSRQTRHNARGVDLNRNFPAANRQNNSRYGFSALSEPESRLIYQLIHQYEPKRIVTVHEEAGCIDYDGPAREWAAHLAAFCLLPVRRLGSQPGSLGSYAGTALGLPIITMELAPDAEKLDENSLWQRYGAALLAAITYPN